MVVTDKLAQLTDNEKLRALYEKEDKINLFSLEGVNVKSILKEKFENIRHELIILPHHSRFFASRLLNLKKVR